jgi:2,3-bisphosphoglycerate-independent phosphoglycerate mutase
MAKPITALIIMDGYGLNPDPRDNAVHMADTPNLDGLMSRWPSTQIAASGMDVGLPEGQMGNSEVGHLNLGAGRIVYQEFTRVTKSIADGDFFENPAFLSCIDRVKATGKKLHLLGLVSPGGVHSHTDHAKAMIRLAKEKGLDQVYLHAFMDGRDVPPESGKSYIEDMEAFMQKEGFGRIATVIGRYYAMDRDNRWERVQRAYQALVMGEGMAAVSAVSAMQKSYDAGVTDEFVEPVVICENGAPVATIEEGDGVIFFNFRPDRAREITRTFIMENFDGFERPKGYFPVHYVTLTQYDATFNGLVSVAYEPQSLDNTLGQVWSAAGLKQLRIAETEKYAHVTFFFNGGVEVPGEGEDRVLIPSPKVATYDLKPEMSAYEVADEAVKRVRSGAYDAMILNFANCDMVGHTGVLQAAIDAVEAVDACVGKVVDAIVQNGGSALVTADHGNADQMVDEETGAPFTAHTTHPVPLILAGEKFKDAKLKSGGRLADLAPTLLDMMGMEKPPEMTGESLIEK